jgi:hypothetical protein
VTGLGVSQPDPPTPTLLTSGAGGVAVRRDVGHPGEGSWASASTCRSRWFRITVDAVDVHRSARKHGVADEDAIHAAGRFLIAYPLSDEGQGGPRRELRLGPDRAGNLLEVVVLLLDDGDELVIHAMRMRPRYRGLLP